MKNEPFWTLVAHFVKRMFAAEDDDSSEGMSLSLGVVLGLLASPGAFASLFLVDKYSTLLQWIRGQRHFDFYKASAADEYFFIVLSMTITGLVMVMRWNRLFPDRRDFANLAALPIPIHHVFLANFTALLGLALVFAVDVNLVSSFFFPAIVTMSDGRLGALAKVGGGHILAVLLASLFSFFLVFALVGVLTLLLPARALRPVSVAMRLVLTVGLLAEFFANLFLRLFIGKMTPERFLPSYWFLGLYESSIGIAKPDAGHWALIALSGTIAVAILAYAICYRRHFLRLAEAFDGLGGSRHGTWLRPPEWLFRSAFEEACSLFAVRVLTRSERHVMFLGGYLGIGLVLLGQSAADDVGALPLTLAFFLITGLRFAFDIPASASANWAFRFSANELAPTPNAIARRLMWVVVLPWQLLPVGPPPAIFLNVGFSVLAIDVVLLNFHRIPFTYRVAPDSRKMVMRFVLAALAFLLLVPLLLWLERRAIVAAAAILAGWIYVWRIRRVQQPSERSLSFEERAPSDFELLKLA